MHAVSQQLPSRCKENKLKSVGMRVATGKYLLTHLSRCMPACCAIHFQSKPTLLSLTLLRARGSQHSATSLMSSATFHGTRRWFFCAHPTTPIRQSEHAHMRVF